MPSPSWELFFSSILKTDVDKLNFDIQENADEIIIDTADATLATRLENILHSPASVITAVDYSLEAKSSDTEPLSPLIHEDYPVPIALVPGTGNEIYKKLFGKILERLGSIQWPAEVANQNRFVLQAQCEERLLMLTKLQINEYIEILSNATFLELRHAIAQDTDAQQTLTLNENKRGLLAKHIDKILYFIETEGKTFVCFDYGLLINCLTPPRLNIAITDQQRQLIRFDKKHLLSYFSVIFQQDFILHILGDRARPICFNMQRSTPVNNVIRLIVDASPSMAQDIKGATVPSIWKDYIEKVISFIEKISHEKNYADAELELTLFSDTTYPTQNCHTNNPQELASIIAYLQQFPLPVYGGTRLTGTISNELGTINTIQKDKNVTLVVFTDGVDSEECLLDENEITAFKSRVNLLKTSSNPIKIYTLGLGEQYDEKLLKQLAEDTGAEHTTDFETISQHCNVMGKARRLIRIVQDFKAFTIPAYEGELVVAKRTVRFPGEFTVDGRPFYAGRRAASHYNYGGAIQLTQFGGASSTRITAQKADEVTVVPRLVGGI